MSCIKPYQDVETRRQYRNQTNTQKKNISELKEGVIVNNLIKDTKEHTDIANMYDSLIIPERTTKPDSFVKIVDNAILKEKDTNKTLIPLIATTVGLFSILATSMSLLANAAKHKTKLPSWQTLPEIPKNVAINNEPHFVTYLMIKDPNLKNVLGALGVFVLSAIGLAGKNFVDGVKEIWVRKKQADVQKDLQEKLIAVETQSFSGKMQILRNMLSEKAKELNNILNQDNIGINNTPFKKFISFKHKEDKTNKNNNLLAYLSIGLSSLLISGLSLLAFRNVQKTAKYYETYEKSMLEKIKNIISNNEKWDDSAIKTIKNLFVSLNVPKAEIQEILTKAKNFPKNTLDEIVVEVEKITQEGAEAIAGKPGSKASFYSHTNDERAHLYNMIVNWENPLLKLLFAGMTTVTTTGYIGSSAIEAIKEVQVIKENAKTELDLQKKLVNVELNNFETKKRSVIEPLIDEFKVQAMQGKNKTELKTRAENILYEIKNGPPFVYS